MPTVYPVNDFGPLMPGLAMAGVAVVHVFLAQFAVGGGFLLCYFQWLWLVLSVAASVQRVRRPGRSDITWSDDAYQPAGRKVSGAFFNRLLGEDA